MNNAHASAMKYLTRLILFLFFSCTLHLHGQEVLRIKNGAILTVQPGTNLTLQGGLTIENGAGLGNNGTVILKNNATLNMSDWLDYSSGGALIGTGLVIFNSTHPHNFSGLTDFYRLRMNAAQLNLNSNMLISDQLELVNGKIVTGSNYAFLHNSSTSSLFNDLSNAGYANCWIHGSFRRNIAANTSIYDFPVGDATRCNLLQFFNNNLSDVADLTGTFGIKPGTDAGINVSEQGANYTAVNNGGVWWLTPGKPPSSGNYSLQLYFNGFAGLSDNKFGILRRADSSSNAADWMVPAGSSLEMYNGPGRKLSDGYARRINISDFSQWGIGMFDEIPCENCLVACSYGHGFYGNPGGLACYTDGSGNSFTITTTQLMLNAFGALTSQVFGSAANQRYFTLYKTDINNGNIYKMLPGAGNSLVLQQDNIAPITGAYYDNQSTWYIVPMQPNGPQRGRINNLLLAQTIALWFNLRNSNILGSVPLTRDTLVTAAQSGCGSGIPTGAPEKFGLPHNVAVYLNGGNGYSPTVNGLFSLANDVLGGVNSDLTPADIQLAVATINNAFDRCRVLVGTLPYIEGEYLTSNNVSGSNLKTPVIKILTVTAIPNPYKTEFGLNIISPISGMAMIEFYSINGAKIHSIKKYLSAHISTRVPYSGPFHRGALVYKVNIGYHQNTGIVIGPE